MSKKKLTPKEMAEIIFEVLQEFKDSGERQKKIDFAVEVLEQFERKEDDPHRQLFQSIRAELFRLGVRHTNQL